MLERGYSLTLDARTGAVVDDASRLGPGAQIDTLLRRGRLRSRVEQLSTGEGERMYDVAASGDPAEAPRPEGHD